MVVQIKSVATKDKLSKANKTLVHYIKVNKSNKKGAAEAIGGRLVVHEGHTVGDFHIMLETTVGGKKQKLAVQAGDVVFRTNDNKRWQLATPAVLKKRFPNAKF